MRPDVLTAAALLPAGTPEFVTTFSHAPNGRVVFGPGVLQDIGRLVAELGVKRVLVVTDPGIAAAGHLQRLNTILEQADLAVTTFTGVRENPDTEIVEACVAVARESKAEAIIGLGGGSSMDAAKGCNFILTNGGKMADYWGVGKATQPMLPFIAIPTTSGTGSECQSFALISDAVTHVKMACGDKKAAATIALLDPELTVTQPAMVTKHTGIDALTHALESAVSTKAGPISRAYSMAAFALLAEGFPRVLAHPSDLRARSQMLLGAAMAGIAIENSMLGAAHACANPLTATFQIVHGEAVGVMMPAVLALNLTHPASAEIYQQLAASLHIEAEALAPWFLQTLAGAGLPISLQHWSITQEALIDLAAQAAVQWTGGFNPVTVGAEELLGLYKTTWARSL
jgi:alcohol dehydrogenase